MYHYKTVTANQVIHTAAGQFVNPVQFPIYLNKYDLKHQLIVTREKEENPISQPLL